MNNIAFGGVRMSHEIVSVKAMQVFTWRFHPGIEVVVKTADDRRAALFVLRVSQPVPMK